MAAAPLDMRAGTDLAHVFRSPDWVSRIWHPAVVETLERLDHNSSPEHVMESTSQSPDRSDISANVKTDELLKLYMTEYSAILGRINTFITLQFFPWPPLAVVLALVVNAFNGQKFDSLTAAFIIWLTAVAAQVAVSIYLFALFEVYNHARYIETELRSKLSQMTGISSIWGYEQFLKKTGKANSPKIGDRYVLLISVLAITLALYARFLAGLILADVILFLVNIAFFLGSWKMTSRVLGARLRMFDGVGA